MAAVAIERRFRKSRRHLPDRSQALAGRATKAEFEDTDRLTLLIAELQHRMRNQLGLVIYLAEKTANETEQIEDFLGAFQMRLTALGRVHGLLSAGRTGENIALDRLLELELAAVSGLDPASFDERLGCEGPADILLNMETAQTMALALHELATNSIKYGALGSTGGRLRIRWSTTHDGTQRWLRLEWRESDLAVSRSAKPACGSGFGRELIERALPLQLGARTRYVATAGTVRCVIELPLEDGAKSA